MLAIAWFTVCNAIFLITKRLQQTDMMCSCFCIGNCRKNETIYQELNLSFCFSSNLPITKFKKIMMSGKFFI